MSSATVRDRILEAALQIVEEQGIKALTQPRAAAAAGVRQSHLTYYFPRKADLFVALLHASHDRAKKKPRKGGAETFDDVMRALESLMFDRQRMRFFLGIVLEASEEDDLRPILAEHARALADRVAAQFGRGGDDPDVVAFIDAVRGMGMRQLLESGGGPPNELNAEKIAGAFGLRRPTGA
ncbi:TetR/AcrR family transcriptional regulator [Methylocystis parvus]|uniref:TetR/AcrR family transcriptional regulator n=1 Tax=Methylocystis parvus TaxID=134 RepID=A0A6B8M8V1_9HYPH|nr:TetR/AcrR family transcriptional regulator [Methylocystis parvus]QGM99036.1 TetR/AcrR family transcriptional regulator [Methylocystis parvus]WBK00597.1 TetR/AcrR family transcriptional regulator [Methylocystis parvus OBBP]